MVAWVLLQKTGSDQAVHPRAMGPIIRMDICIARFIATLLLAYGTAFALDEVCITLFLSKAERPAARQAWGQRNRFHAACPA